MPRTGRRTTCIARRRSFWIAGAEDEFGGPFAELDEEHQGQLTARLSKQFRANDYDPDTGTLTVDPLRAEAFKANVEHYAVVFMEGNADYAIPAGAVSSKQRVRDLTAFFFWTSWASAATRLGDDASYTNNWPHEPLVGNRPTGDNVVWTGVSIIMLLGRYLGHGLVVRFAQGGRRNRRPAARFRSARAMGSDAVAGGRRSNTSGWSPALILVQMGLGVVTAHYGVEGDGFYGFPLSEWLPYSVSRTWHIQMGLFWIATAWLAAGLFIGPLVSDVEPKGQKLGVNILFGALLLWWWLVRWRANG